MAEEQIKVAVCGACGRMGQEVVKAVSHAEGMEITSVIDVNGYGQNIGKITGLESLPMEITADLEEAIVKNSRIDVIVDFTTPDSVFKNIKTALNYNKRVVVGTTGLHPDQIKEIATISQGKKCGVIIAPNFAIGAVLMMMFAQKASEYLDHAEIIELHHNQKVDAPSGTAIKTAELMETTRENFGITNVTDQETIKSARGARRSSGINIHSVRLPGLVAHQEVIFGGKGQILTIRHDSIDRTSFMPGVILAIRKVMQLSELVYGLEKIL